jgi:dihydrolipoamide dehydrogenase
MAELNFDVVIIGSGPGGYVGAIRAAQLGFKTALIEKDKTLGGTCLNVGCIPSKALLESSENYSMALHDFASHGINTNGVSFDLTTMMSRKDKIVKELTGGIAYLMKKNKVEWIAGLGRITSANSIEVTNGSEKQTVNAKNIIIATGSVPNALPGALFDEKVIVSSTGALALKEVPKHLIVIGGGVIGLELGSVWLRLGAKVTVIEFADRICATMDQQIIKKLNQILEKQGMEFQLGSKVTGIETSAKGAIVNFENIQSGKATSITGDVVLIATGRRPYTEGLGLEELGIEKDKRGLVMVNDHFQTKFPNVYAIGDVIRGPMLAHKAEEEGVAVAEIIAGQAGHVNYETCPGIIYTWPEVASVGLTEEQVKAQGIAYKVGTFPFTANGRAKAMGTTEGMVKILSDAKTDRVIGAHVLGPRASDLIAELVMAMEFGASSEDIARTFHGHPTLSEVVREAALNVDKLARQM